jgi:membrane protein
LNRLKVFLNFFDNETLYYSASLSFFTIFSILPLLALFIVVLSTMPLFTKDTDILMLYILDYINPTHSIRLASVLDKFLSNTKDLGSIGMFYLLFVFTIFFKDYEYIVNKIFNVKARSVYKLFFTYLAFLILVPVLFIVSIFVSTHSSLTINSHIATFIFIWMLFVILFTISANTKISFRSAYLSSFVTLAILSLTKYFFSYYVLVNTTYATIYGSFSIVLFFFLWIYVSWIIYLYGIKFCALLNKKESNTQ